jgi:acyl carrier protein
MPDTIPERVIRVIARSQHIPEEAITAGSTFAQLNIDSLDALQLLFVLEEEFGVDIPDDMARGFTSVEHASAGISGLLARKEQAPETA